MRFSLKPVDKSGKTVDNCGVLWKTSIFLQFIRSALGGIDPQPWGVVLILTCICNSAILVLKRRSLRQFSFRRFPRMTPRLHRQGWTNFLRFSRQGWGASTPVRRALGEFSPPREFLHSIHSPYEYYESIQIQIKLRDMGRMHSPEGSPKLLGA